MGELELDDERLQQEHDALDVQHILVVGHRARPVVDDHVELEHLCVVTREGCEALSLPLLPLLLGLFFESEHDGFVCGVVVEVSRPEKHRVDGL